MHNIPVTPPPPQTTAIYRDFKKSTAICKVYNVGLRYIKEIFFEQPNFWQSQPQRRILTDRRPSTAACPACWPMGTKELMYDAPPHAPPPSASWAGNTIATECTHESCHLQSLYSLLWLATLGVFTTLHEWVYTLPLPTKKWNYKDDLSNTSLRHSLTYTVHACPVQLSYKMQ